MKKKLKESVKYATLSVAVMVFVVAFALLTKIAIYFITR